LSETKLSGGGAVEEQEKRISKFRKARKLIYIIFVACHLLSSIIRITEKTQPEVANKFKKK